MLNTFRFSLLLLAAILVSPDYASAQSKDFKSLPDKASLAETQKWLVAAIGKNASYKARASSATVADIAFEGCKLSYTVEQKSGSTAHATMGATTRTYKVKHEVAFDLSFVFPDDIRLADHPFPELQTIVIGLRAADSQSQKTPLQETEIVVKYEAAEQIRAALVHAQRLCVRSN